MRKIKRAICFVLEGLYFFLVCIPLGLAMYVLVSVYWLFKK